MKNLEFSAHCFGRGQAGQHFKLSALMANATTDSFTMRMVIHSISCINPIMTGGFGLSKNSGHLFPLSRVLH